MARTAIPTYTTGDLVSASHANTYWRDNESAHWSKISLWDASSTSMSGTKTLTDADVVWQFLDPNGNNRDVTLPAVGASNHIFWIRNTSDTVWETLTVKNAGGTVIAYVMPQGEATFISSESAWYSVEGRYKEIFVKSWIPSITNGCADVATLEMSTNKQTFSYYAFDQTTVESAVADVGMPDDWIGGSVYFICYWTHPSTSTNYGVVWGLCGISYVEGVSLDAAYGTVVNSSDTGGSTNYLYRSPISTGVTLSGTVTPGALVQYKIQRTADNGNDTMAVDAYLLGTMIYYKVG